MASLSTKGSFLKLYSWLPILILYISVLNEFDFNYLNLEYFSFNFPFILIFFFTLKDFKYFDYVLVFIAGLFNDTVVGLPLGISSLSYTLICIATAYLRNITIRPSPMKDWFYFLFIISLINDTVVGLPLGISSLSYMFICIATSYFRNITIRPNSVKDWFYFLFIISLINSLNYSILTLFFSFNLILMNYIVNTFFTFLFYIIFVSIFKFYLKGLND